MIDFICMMQFFGVLLIGIVFFPLLFVLFISYIILFSFFIIGTFIYKLFFNVIDEIVSKTIEYFDR